MAIEVDRSSATPPRASFLNDPRIRGIIYQLIVLVLVIGAGAYLVRNTIVNRERLGVATGFGFLDSTAGFDIAQTLIPYTELSSYGSAFIVGLLNTFYCALVGVILCTTIGFIVGLARLSENWLVNKMAMVYVETLRNIPLLLQLIFWYIVVLGALPLPRESLTLGEGVALNVRGLFLPRPVFEPGSMVVGIVALASIIGVIWLARWAKRRREATGQPFQTLPIGLAIVFGVPLLAFLIMGRPMSFENPELGAFRIIGGIAFLPEFIAIVLGLSLYTAAFIAEIVRSGILSVGKGQREAAAAIGLTQGQTMRLVIIPQGLRVIIPPLTSQYLNLTKNSSLGVAIGYPEFFNVAGTINNQTGQAVEVIAITMAVYLALSLTISFFMNWYNAHMALVER